MDFHGDEDIVGELLQADPKSNLLDTVITLLIRGFISAFVFRSIGKNRISLNLMLDCFETKIGICE